MTVSEQEYRQLALAEPDEKWELFCGELRIRPPMTWDHIYTAARFCRDLQDQLPRDQYIVFTHAGRLRCDERHYFIPDVMVVPIALARGLFPEVGMLAAFPVPLPFVAEVWSPPSGDYEVTDKLPEYRQRGDAEIWFLQPWEGTVTVWVRQPDGDYTETLYHSGTVRISALPGVAIDLDEFFPD